jgi:hypothetical protein
MSPPKRKPPWLSEARAQGGQSFDGSSATIGDQDSKASTERRRLQDAVRPLIHDILDGVKALQASAREFQLHPYLTTTELWLVARGLKRACNRLLFEASRIGTGRSRSLNACNLPGWPSVVSVGERLTTSTGQWLPLSPKLQWIDDEARALCVAMVEFILNPQQRRSERLRTIAAGLYRKCNQLAHHLERMPTS